MDPVARPIEADPGDTDGVVRPGREDQFAAQLAGFGGLGKHFGIEGVVRIAHDNDHVQLANGPLVHPAGNAHREVRDRSGRCVLDLEGAVGETNHDPGGDAELLRAKNRGCAEANLARQRVPRHARIDPAQEGGPGVVPFGGQF